MNHRYGQDLFSRGRDLGVPGNYNLNNAANLYASEANSTIRTFAHFFDLNLAYQNYLFLGVTGRREVASTFGTAKNDFFYPSANLSLVFTELVKIPTLSFGKIRVAYAQAGISPSAYGTQTYFVRSTYTDGFTGGLSFPYTGINGYGYSNTLGNPNLRPERNTGREIGLDLRFFEGRLGFDFTYYVQRSTDLLVYRPVAPSSGFSQSYENLGEMENRGIELMVNATPIQKKDFQWDITLNFTRARNEVLKLADGVKELSLEAGFASMGSYAIVGEPYGVFYGTKWARNSSGQLIIGTNGLPTVDPVRGNLGNPYPDWFGGLRNTFTYKNVSLTCLLDVRQGGSIWNGTWARLQQIGNTEESAEGREKAYIIEGVKADGTTNDIAISAFNYFRTFKGDGGNYASENAMQDGSWIRLRDLGISYKFTTLPATVSKYVKGLELGIVGRNLWLKTDYTGVDPETSLTGAGSNIGGWDYFNNPSTKSYTFSLKANF
jgi:outer membrane receptor protein involved in Fe transport